MTLAKLRELYWDVLDDPQGGYFTESVANLRLNLAAQELQKHLLRANKEYYTQCVTAVTVANQARYALPSDFFQLNKLEYVLQGSGDTAEKQTIEYRAPNSRDILDCYNSGDPVFYYFQKNYLVLAPCPNRVITLHLDYSPLIAPMILDSDVPDAPEQYHYMIYILAARTGFIKDGRSLAPIQEELKEFEKQMESIANQRRVDGPRMITATSGGFGDY